MSTQTTLRTAGKQTLVAFCILILNIQEIIQLATNAIGESKPAMKTQVVSKQAIVVNLLPTMTRYIQPM